MDQITNAPRSSGKGLAELHEAAKVVTSLLLVVVLLLLLLLLQWLALRRSRMHRAAVARS
jgi:hypothetical protein